MKNDEDIDEKYCFPICHLCGAILNINLGLNVNISCEKDDLSKKISYLEFNKAYFKNIYQLNNELLKNNNLPSYMNEEIKRNYNHILNYFNKKQICKEHNYDKTIYCKNCNKNICLFCKSKHFNHDIIKYIDIIPTEFNYENLKNKIEERENNVKKIIIMLEEWKKDIFKMIEKLKNILKEEINFLKKFYFSFNNRYLNYNYIKNFNNIYNYLNNADINNLLNKKKLNDLCNKKKLSDKTKILNEIFMELEKEKKLSMSIYNLKDEFGFITLLTDNYFIYEKNGIIYLAYYYKNKINNVSKIVLNENYKRLDEICEVSVSSFTNKIFIILNGEYIYIIKYNLNLGKEQLSIIKIIEEKQNLSFCNCVEIKNDYYLISSLNYILLFIDNTIVKKKEFDNNIEALLPINNEYFIVLNGCYIDFYDLKEFKSIKKIKHNNLILNIFKFQENYVIYTSEQGIKIIYLKTKEIIQNIQIYDLFNCFFYVKMNNIFIISNYYIFDIKYLPDDKEFIVDELPSDGYGLYNPQITLLCYALYKNF